MWRQGGAGEGQYSNRAWRFFTASSIADTLAVYAYIPSTTTLCTQGSTICNSDYGVSLGRGQFTFATGKWQTIWLLVVLNEVGRSNGMIE
jgi:hypothetical protein